MREMNLIRNFDPVSVTDTSTRRGPLSNTIQGEYCRIPERGGICSATRRLRGILACEHGPQRYLLRPMAHGEGEPNLGIPTYSVPVSYKFDKQLLQNILEISPTKFCTSP